MRHAQLLAIALLIVIPVTTNAEESNPQPIAQRGDLLFSDDFERADLGDWQVIIPGFRVSDGELVGTQDREDHGSVGRVYLPMSDVVLSFRFQLAGSPRFNLVFDDKNHKGSHAGHICRVAVAQKQIRLGDDKEGIMRNDLFEMRRDPKQRQAAEKLLEGRGVSAKVDLESNRWYKLEVQILGDRMQVSLDGKIIGSLKSPGIAHPTKESLHFTVSGKETRFDDVQVWRAIAN